MLLTHKFTSENHPVLFIRQCYQVQQVLKLFVPGFSRVFWGSVVMQYHHIAWCCCCSRPWGKKTFFHVQLSWAWKFFLLINVKMPTIVDILTFMSRKISILDFSEPEKYWISWYFHSYENLKHLDCPWSFYLSFFRSVRYNVPSGQTKSKIVWC